MSPDDVHEHVIPGTGENFTHIHAGGSESHEHEFRPGEYPVADDLAPRHAEFRARIEPGKWVGGTFVPNSKDTALV